MNEFTFFIDLVKNLGFPALIFIIFFIYHKSQTNILIDIIKNMEMREKALTDYLHSQIETLQSLISTLSRIEYKIDQGMQCPIRKEIVK